MLRFFLNIYIIFILAVLLLFSYYYLKILKYNKVDSDFIYFYITLVGTFFGALIAIITSHIYESLKKRYFLLQLYTAAILELEEILDEIGTFYRFSTFNFNSPTGQKLRLPRTIDAITSDIGHHNFFSKNMRGNIFGKLHISSFENTINMINLFSSNSFEPVKINKDDSNEISGTTSMLITYFNQLDFTRRIIYIERNYLTSLMTTKKVGEKWNEVYKLINEQTEKMKNTKYEMKMVD